MDAGLLENKIAGFDNVLFTIEDHFGFTSYEN